MHLAVCRNWYKCGSVSSVSWKIKLISAYVLVIKSKARNDTQASGEKPPLFINIGNDVIYKL